MQDHHRTPSTAGKRAAKSEATNFVENQRDGSRGRCVDDCGTGVCPSDSFATSRIGLGVIHTRAYITKKDSLKTLF